MAEFLCIFFCVFGMLVKVSIEFGDELPVIEIRHFRDPKDLYNKKHTSKLIVLIFCNNKASCNFLRLILLSILFLGIIIILF